jgi:hypothetical protein
MLFHHKPMLQNVAVAICTRVIFGHHFPIPSAVAPPPTPRTKLRTSDLVPFFVQDSAPELKIVFVAPSSSPHRFFATRLPAVIFLKLEGNTFGFPKRTTFLVDQSVP